MAPMNEITTSSHEERLAWNEAYDRLQKYLDGFMLHDHPEVSRLALKFLDDARERHRQDPSQHPTAIVIPQTQKTMIEWLATNLKATDRSPAQIYSTGCVALLLSRTPQANPSAFLASPLPENLGQAIRETLVVIGPDLNVSSMTPRHLDYGPLLDLAQRTWHRWNGRALLIAVLFWIGVYMVAYWWLSDAL
jgi:hypothetical protein